MNSIPVDIADGPALGLFFGNKGSDSKVTDKPDALLPIMFSPGEFNLSPGAHLAFVNRIFRHARMAKVAFIGGTEASQQANNNTRKALTDLAPQYGFTIYSSPHGEWLACNNIFGTLIQGGFTEIIPAQGSVPGQIGHDARGITHAHMESHDPRVGTVHVGVSHWLARGTDPNSERGKLNLKLERGIGEWAKGVGKGSGLVFYMGDTNLDDKHRNAFNGVPITSCWDELHKWPITHPHPNGGGPTLDIIGSYDHDKRVKCRSARALNDAILPLPVDHFSVYAEYMIKPLKGK